MSKRHSPAKKFWIKLTHWEFWPFNVVYLPVFFYVAWLMIRCRSFFFFTASNPSIDFGGMLGESKNDIFKLIPNQYLPKYRLFQPSDFDSAKAFCSQISFPIIAKPDIGERGILVKKIHTTEELKSYVRNCPVPFLIQEFVDLPVELGVFYVRLPGVSRGQVSSIVRKDFLKVIGDGKSTIKSLLNQNPRAILQLDFEQDSIKKLENQIPKNGEEVLIEPIGNHCRGTTFINDLDQINEKLNQAFDSLADQIEGFHFGRFDLKCSSYADLIELKNFKILELNGAGAEPGHIYQPGYSIWKGYKAIFWHLRVLAQISRANHRLGIPYWTFARGIRKLKTIRQYNRRISKAS